jgi:AbrB family looped-hinge helix DNA binding protein
MGAIRSRLTAKGQTTIPKAVREALHVKAGDLLEFEVEQDAVRIRKERRRILPIFDCLRRAW